MKKTLLKTICALITGAFATMPLLAASTDAWVGNTDGNWSTSANWSFSSGSGPVASGDSLVFGAAGSAGASLANDLAGLSLLELTFNSSAAAYSISGNAFTLIGNLTDSATVNVSLPGVTIGAGGSATIKNLGSGTLALGSLSQGASGTVLLTKTSPISTTTVSPLRRVSGDNIIDGWVVIDNGNNTYDWANSGASGGTIVAATYGLGSTGNAGNVRYQSGTTGFDLNGSWVSINLQGASTVLNIGNSASSTLGVFLDSGGIILSGGARLGGNRTIKSNNSKFYVYVPDSGTINNSQGLLNNGANPATLIKSGPGTLFLPVANGYTGGALLYAGTVSVGNAAAFGTAAGTLTFAGGNLDCSSANLTLNNLPQAWNSDFTFAGTQNLNLGNGAVTLGASRQVTVSANTLTVGGIISGSGFGVTKAGGGTLKLTGVNAYTGATTVNAGTLEVATSGTGIASGSAVTVNASGTLLVNSGATVGSSSVAVSGGTLRGGGTISGSTTISSSGALTPRPSGGSATTTTFGGSLTLSSAAANFTLSATAAGSNDKVVYGNSGTLTLDNSDTINITCTTLQQSDYTLFSTTGGTLSMASMPTLKTNGVTVIPAANRFIITNVGNNVILRYQQPATPATVTAQTASPATIPHRGSTVLTVSATAASGDSISSVTVTADGLAAAGNPTALISDGAGNWTNSFTAAGSLALGNYVVSGNVVESSGAVATWAVTVSVINTNTTWSGSGADNKWSTVNNWNFGLNPGPSDNVFFSGSAQPVNDLDASLSIGSLTFNSGAGSFVITNATSTLTLVGGVTNNSTSAQTLEVPVALSGAQTINAAAGNIALNGAVSGSGAALTKVGGAALVLAGVNTYSGATIIDGGALIVSGAGQLGGGTYSAVITNNGVLSLNSSASQTLSGIISGAGILTKAGANTLNLAAANVFTGGVTNSGGTIALGNAAALGTGAVTLNGGTVVNAAGVDITVVNDFVADTGGGIITLGEAKNLSLTGSLSGSGNLTIGGPNPLSSLNLFLAANTCSGTITIPNNTANNQTVTRFKTATTGSATAAWSIGGAPDRGTTLDFSTGTLDFGALSGSGIIGGNAVGLKTLAVGALGTSTIFSGQIRDSAPFGSGTVALTKVGTGSLTLSGANTYTGSTIVSNGTLLVNGSLAGGSSVAVSGGTIGGTGTIGGAVTVNAGGALAPGAGGVGTLTLGNNLTFAAGSIASFEINKAAGPVYSADQAAVTGAITFGGALNVISNANSAAFVAGDNFTLFTGNSIGGWFNAVTLPSLSAGLTWDTNQLATSGVLSVYDFRTNAIQTMVALRNTATTLKQSKLTSKTAGARGTVGVQNVNSSSGATVGISGSDITYTPPSNFVGTDTFTAVLGDGHGTINATVLVTVSAANVGVALAVDNGYQTNGGYGSFTASGMPDITYDVEVASSVTGPWGAADNATVTASAAGFISYTDTKTIGAYGGAVFYRLRQP